VKRFNKYGAKKTPCGQGHTHASQREAKRCNELHFLLRAGEIERLTIEPQFWFAIAGVQMKHDNGRRVGYKPDFHYWDRLSGAEIVEDTKGFAVRDWPLRKAVFRALYPHVRLIEV
jgi:hypothetical protein